MWCTFESHYNVGQHRNTANYPIAFTIYVDSQISQNHTRVCFLFEPQCDSVKFWNLKHSGRRAIPLLLLLGFVARKCAQSIVIPPLIYRAQEGVNILRTMCTLDDVRKIYPKREVVYIWKIEEIQAIRPVRCAQSDVSRFNGLRWISQKEHPHVMKALGHGKNVEKVGLLIVRSQYYRFYFDGKKHHEIRSTRPGKLGVPIYIIEKGAKFIYLKGRLESFVQLDVPPKVKSYTFSPLHGMRN